MSWRTIAIGDYLVDCPADFELIKENGIDSYVGKLKDDSLTLYFDLGYYSNDFTSTPEQYLESKIWVMDASYQFLEGGEIYTSGDIPKMGVLSIRVATNGFNESINSHLALSIATDSITKSQQKLVVKILSTVRPKPGR